MGTDSPGPSRLTPRARWMIWLGGLVIWTYLLVVPIDWLPPFLRFHGTLSPLLTWGKFGHACAYAALAALVPLVPVGFAGHVGLWAFLSAHAFATEYIQTYVPTRTGTWTDVAIDHSGWLIGLGLSRLWRRRGLTPVDSQEHAGSEDQNADLLRHR